jgi:hypothetical protein
MSLLCDMAAREFSLVVAVSKTIAWIMLDFALFLIGCITNYIEGTALDGSDVTRFRGSSNASRCGSCAACRRRGSITDMILRMEGLHHHHCPGLCIHPRRSQPIAMQRLCAHLRQPPKDMLHMDSEHLGVRHPHDACLASSGALSATGGGSAATAGLTWGRSASRAASTCFPTNKHPLRDEMMTRAR